MLVSLLLASSILLSNPPDTVPQKADEPEMVISSSEYLVYLGRGKARLDFVQTEDPITSFTITLNLNPILVIKTDSLKKGERFIMNVDVSKFLKDRTLKPDTITPYLKRVSTPLEQ
jgi:hypothetical protein